MADASISFPGFDWIPHITRSCSDSTKDDAQSVQESIKHTKDNKNCASQNDKYKSIPQRIPRQTVNAAKHNILKRLPKSRNTRVATLRTVFNSLSPASKHYLKEDLQTFVSPKDRVLSELASNVIQAIKHNSAMNSSFENSIVARTITNNELKSRRLIKRLSDEVNIPWKLLAGRKNRENKIKCNANKKSSIDYRVVIKNFLERDDISRQLPCKRFVLRIKSDDGAKVPVMKRVLYKSMHKCYNQFKQEFLEYKYIFLHQL